MCDDTILISSEASAKLDTLLAVAEKSEVLAFMDFCKEKVWHYCFKIFVLSPCTTPWVRQSREWKPCSLCMLRFCFFLLGEGASLLVSQAAEFSRNLLELETVQGQLAAQVGFRIPQMCQEMLNKSVDTLIHDKL